MGMGVNTKWKPVCGGITLTCLRRSPAKGVLGPRLSRWVSPKHINKLLIFYKDGSLPWSAGGHPVSPHNCGGSAPGLCWQACQGVTESTQRGAAGRTWPHCHCLAEPWAAAPGPSAQSDVQEGHQPNPALPGPAHDSPKRRAPRQPCCAESFIKWSFGDSFVKWHLKFSPGLYLGNPLAHNIMAQWLKTSSLLKRKTQQSLWV